ncbi:3-methyl-2-oxobutanoate hydroxymethyltransferase [Curvivirga aplysinae]|uniref:3-methyl-2-oxobutanoate hydroxymethyltransferase n=1 Tax=Curvivirga aplysinae TaxID=2529852 RepID=UPI0012BC9161|nr:3-methyl-2-oxobutanoate hydroxymethyltransferase [Curvivirga aplysinae]MTI11448.1 3-methyl-2-oxobutanoate hydroxymethyltransferase [Curvivirga aplysinae]
MSKVPSTVPRRLGVPEVRARKGDTPIVVLTAYTAPIAKIVDQHADIILVGDSLGMVIYGMENTLGVTMDMMINHGKAVSSMTKNALIVVDMPFGSFEESKEVAFRNAVRLMAEGGANAVKIEGGRDVAPTIDFLTQRGIPVMAHVGLMPQRVQAMGGFRAQGKDEASANEILKDALAVQEAGAFSVVIEGVMEPVGRKITEELDIPTIGIGASAACDGQVLVIDDILGIFDEFKPKFVKRYANLNKDINAAIEDFCSEVRSGAFPADEHLFGTKSTAKKDAS